MFCSSQCSVAPSHWRSFIPSSLFHHVAPSLCHSFVAPSLCRPFPLLPLPSVAPSHCPSFTLLLLHFVALSLLCFLAPSLLHSVSWSLSSRASGENVILTCLSFCPVSECISSMWTVHPASCSEVVVFFSHSVLTLRFSPSQSPYLLTVPWQQRTLRCLHKDHRWHIINQKSINWSFFWPSFICI